jgi:K+-sensing histidine kinase KdpD
LFNKKRLVVSKQAINCAINLLLLVKSSDLFKFISLLALIIFLTCGCALNALIILIVLLLFLLAILISSLGGGTGGAFLLILVNVKL